VLRPGSVAVCFSLYPLPARVPFFLAALPAEAGGESEQELAEWRDVLSADNPPSVLRNTAAWREICMAPLDISLVEMPNQKHTFLYVAVNR